MMLEENIPLAPLTTLRVGGPARYLVRVATIPELRKAVQFAEKTNLPLFVLGGGSNIVISDEGWHGVVVKIEIQGVNFEKDGKEVLITAGAGEVWDVLVRESVSHSLYGLENLSGIPGTVGATPIQNVGAYGVEAQDCIEWVEVFDVHSYGVKTLSSSECSFSYRDSIFRNDEGKRYIVTRVQFRVGGTRGPVYAYRDISMYMDRYPSRYITPHVMRNIVLSIRAKKFPDITQTGTAGSFFKNPIIGRKQYEKLCAQFQGLPGYEVQGDVKIPLAYILEARGWKGVQREHVGSFEHQPLVLITKDGATARELKQFAQNIMDDVISATNISIVPEVTFVG